MAVLADAGCKRTEPAYCLEARSSSRRVCDEKSRARAFDEAVVSAMAAPVFTIHPAARTVLAVGERLELRAEATGTGAPTYQWKHQGRAIAGATQPTYAVPAVTWSDAGDYVVEAKDDSGVAERAVAWVNIAPAWPVVTTLGGGAATIPVGQKKVIGKLSARAAGSGCG